MTLSEKVLEVEHSNMQLASETETISKWSFSKLEGGTTEEGPIAKFPQNPRSNLLARSDNFKSVPKPLPDPKRSKTLNARLVLPFHAL